MVRPFKQGVDYFPLDVHLDNKFKFIEIKFGLKGFAIVIKIFQNIYSQGYWSSWGEDEKIIFASENKIDLEEIENITNECLKRDIFDKALYEQYEILTSLGIQKRYKEIVRRRKDVTLIAEYLLIEWSSIVNDDINPALSKQDDDKSTQRKGKEKKVKEKKVKETKTQYAEFVSLTENEHSKLVSEHGESKVKEMIRILDNYKGANGKKYASDYRAILNWVIDRVKNTPDTIPGQTSIDDFDLED